MFEQHKVLRLQVKNVGRASGTQLQQSKLCNYNCFDFVVADPWSAENDNF
jgi:hypothetical protein